MLTSFSTALAVSGFLVGSCTSVWSVVGTLSDRSAVIVSFAHCVAWQSFVQLYPLPSCPLHYHVRYRHLRPLSQVGSQGSPVS